MSISARKIGYTKQMTCLSNLASNMVYASPDSPTTGYSDFRNLTANDLPGFATVSITSSVNVGPSNTHDIIVLTLPIPANSLSPGDTFRITVLAEANGGGFHANTRFGANGNIADQLVMFIIPPGTESQTTVNVGGTSTPWGEEIFQQLLTVRSIGNSAVLVVGQILPIVTNYDGYQSGGSPFPLINFSTIDTTVNNYITWSAVMPSVNVHMATIEHL